MQYAQTLYNYLIQYSFCKAIFNLVCTNLDQGNISEQHITVCLVAINFTDPDLVCSNVTELTGNEIWFTHIANHWGVKTSRKWPFQVFVVYFIHRYPHLNTKATMVTGIYHTNQANECVICPADAGCLIFKPNMTTSVSKTLGSMQAQSSNKTNWLGFAATKPNWHMEQPALTSCWTLNCHLVWMFVLLCDHSQHLSDVSFVTPDSHLLIPLQQYHPEYESTQRHYLQIWAMLHRYKFMQFAIILHSDHNRDTPQWYPQA